MCVCVCVCVLKVKSSRLKAIVPIGNSQQVDVRGYARAGGQRLH